MASRIVALAVIILAISVAVLAMVGDYAPAVVVCEAGYTLSDAGNGCVPLPSLS